MIKHIHTFGSSFTEGGGFEWWKYEEVKYIYRPYIDKYPKEETSFHFSWPGQLKKLIDESHLNITIDNYGRCGWGNERAYRKMFEIVTAKGFVPKENLFLIEFSDNSRAEFWSVEKQKHFLCNYDMGDENREGLLYKKNVEPVFDYHRETFKDEKQYLNGIAPMMTDFLRTTKGDNDVMRKVEQNQITFSSFLNLHNINWLVPLPNAFCWHPLWHDKLYKDKFVVSSGAISGNECGSQYTIVENNYGFETETHGFHTDFHGGLAWSQMVAMKTYNLMIDGGYIDKEKLDTSKKNLIRLRKKISNEINDRVPEIRTFYDDLEGHRKRGGLSVEEFLKDLI